MYDPEHGVLYAWRTLGQQWRRAFEIGAANRERGLEPESATSLLRTYREYTRMRAESERQLAQTLVLFEPGISRVVNRLQTVRESQTSGVQELPRPR